MALLQLPSGRPHCRDDLFSKAMAPFAGQLYIFAASFKICRRVYNAGLKAGGKGIRGAGVGSKQWQRRRAL